MDQLSRFQNLLAEVAYNPVKVGQVKRGLFIKETPGGPKRQQEVECFYYRLKKDKVLPENPVRSDSLFWQKLCQLSFALEDGEDGKIKEFFLHYGPIAPVAEGIEEVERLREHLLFFRELTNWVRWLKEERTGALWERIEEGQRILDTTVFQSTPKVYYTLKQAVETPPDIVLSDGRRKVHLSATGSIHSSLHVYGMVIPSSEKRLISLCWQTVAQAAARYLETIPFVPEANGGIILFRFKARGALDAAFLQWFFKEFVSDRVCAAEGCENPVFGRTDKVYCSEKCKNREKMRRYRERKKEGQVRWS